MTNKKLNEELKKQVDSFKSENMNIKNASRLGIPLSREDLQSMVDCSCGPTGEHPL